jgi:sugar phosphate permease
MLNKLNNGIYAGWKTHIGAFICALMVVGTTGYAFGLFVVPVSEDLRLSRATVNNGYIAFLLGVALISPFAGRLLDRLSTRITITAGGIVFGLGMIGLANVHILPVMLVLIAVPISFGMAICGTLAANTIVVRWFRRRRGRALGVLAVSTSLGGFIFNPFIALLIDNFGWRMALMIVGALVAVIVPLVNLLLIRDRPTGDEQGYAEEMNDDDCIGDTTGEQPQADNNREWSYSELLRNRNFWFVSIALTLLFSSDQALLVSQIAHFRDAGIDLTAAAMIGSFMAMSAMGGKILVGYMADKVDLRFVFFAVAIAHVVLLMLYIWMPPYWALLLLATMFGVGVGGVFPVWSTLLAWLFGPKSYGSIMGLMTIPLKGFSMLSVRFVGEMHDSTGSYTLAFIFFTAAILFSILMVWMVRPPARPASQSKA